MKEHKTQNCTHHSKPRAPKDHTRRSNLQVQIVHPTFVCKTAHIVQKTRQALPSVESWLRSQTCAPRCRTLPHLRAFIHSDMSRPDNGNSACESRGRSHVGSHEPSPESSLVSSSVASSFSVLAPLSETRGETSDRARSSQARGWVTGIR